MPQATRGPQGAQNFLGAAAHYTRKLRGAAIGGAGGDPPEDLENNEARRKRLREQEALMSTADKWDESSKKLRAQAHALSKPGDNKLPTCPLQRKEQIRADTVKNVTAKSSDYRARASGAAAPTNKTTAGPTESENASPPADQTHLEFAEQEVKEQDVRRQHEIRIAQAEWLGRQRAAVSARVAPPNATPTLEEVAREHGIQHPSGGDPVHPPGLGGIFGKRPVTAPSQFAMPPPPPLGQAGTTPGAHTTPSTQMPPQQDDLPPAVPSPGGCDSADPTLMPVIRHSGAGFNRNAHNWPPLPMRDGGMLLPSGVGKLIRQFANRTRDENRRLREHPSNARRWICMHACMHAC